MRRGMRILCALTAVTLLVSAVSSCGMVAVYDKGQNVFEEIYYDVYYTRNRVDQVPTLTYDQSWEYMGSPWHGDTAYLFCTGMDSGEQFLLYATKEEATITFVRRVEHSKDPRREAYYSYRYALSTKELTYSTNDYEATEADRYLFEVFLEAWYQANHPEGEQSYKTAYSPADWGEYVLVTPYDVTPESDTTP